MSNYTLTTDFSTKDNLATGNASKVIKGSEVDSELSAIATAISSKGDATTTVIPSGTKMLFIATAVPSGWTLVETWDDKALVLNSSITSSNAFTTAGNWTISGTQLTSNTATHSHNSSFTVSTLTNGATGAASGGRHTMANDSHNHTLSGTTGTASALSVTHSGTMVDGTWRPAYVEIIACSKNEV